MPSKQSGEMTA